MQSLSMCTDYDLKSEVLRPKERVVTKAIV